MSPAVWALVALTGVAGGAVGCLAMLVASGVLLWPGRPDGHLDLPPASDETVWGPDHVPVEHPPNLPKLPQRRPRSDWGGYPAPHEDPDDTCPCPDHMVMRWRWQ